MLDLLARDVITAQATPHGAGAIGIVRLSGSGSRVLLASLLSDTARERWAIHEPRTLSRYTLLHPGTRHPLDEVLLIPFDEGQSFTGEESVEIHGHGAPFVVEGLVHALLDAGARLAEPGEFSYRAFRSGRIDLSEAEGLLTLGTATNAAGQSGGLELLQGGLKREVESLRASLTQVLAELEVAFDYPEDHVSGYDTATIAEALTPIGERLAGLLDSYQSQQTRVEGLKVVIVGAPNAGKSSLLNALAGITRALVHATPGTTRDVVEAVLVRDGLRFVIYDTAGMREAPEEVEAAGLTLAAEYIARADLLIHVIDASALPGEADALLLAMRPEVPRLVVLNKEDVEAHPDLQGWLDLAGITEPLVLSALTGDGLEGLRQALVELARPLAASLAGTGSHYLTGRQYSCFREALAETDRALVAVAQGQPEDIVALHLREVLTPLLAITGEVYDETVLQAIFSQFCVGK